MPDSGPAGKYDPAALHSAGNSLTIMMGRITEKVLQNLGWVLREFRAWKTILGVSPLNPN